VTVALGEAHVTVLEATARALAARHIVSRQKPRPIPTLGGLHVLSRWLERARADLAASEAATSKAAEWLLDNAYLAQRAVRQIREDLPPGFFARLPALTSSGDGGGARIRVIAAAVLHASDLHVDPSTVTRFVNVYQETAPLDMSELWALPTMLRLVLLEILVAAVQRVAPARAAPFALEASPAAPPSLDDAECVARAIRGLQTISAISWRQFFRDTSLVEAILRTDPAGAYGRMDFATCDRYRKVVERIARGTRRLEVDVAAAAIEQARRAAGGAARLVHVGYWLVDEGRASFDRAVGFVPGAPERWRRRLGRHATALYLLGVGAGTTAAAAVPGAYLYTVGAGALGWVLTMPLVVLPASALAVAVVQWVATLLTAPRVLPKLDFDGAIPPECRTAVVIPALLTSPDEVADLLVKLERHHLCNPDPMLRFALLTDFGDAAAPRSSGDEALLQQAASGIRRLNARHGTDGIGPFHLLHRERRYDPSEGCWMGWERKRGKLEELNRLLGGDRTTSYTVHEGDPRGLRDVAFVITLDADTSLPHGAAARLVGTLAHPLNRAEADPATGRVRTGYTILQPRVEILPESSNRSRFAQIYAGDTTIDIYSRAVSDAYQDLFGAGVYVGKGIYDVAAFRRSLDGWVPDHALLSHDLFEGIHGRVALVTDVVVYEEYPPTYLTFTRRMHRWIRGDWQLLPWLRRHVPGRGRTRLRNRLAVIDRWKILDNLRRSLVAPALLLLLTAGWLALPGHPLVWTLLATLVPAAALLIAVAGRLVHHRRRNALRGAMAAVGQSLEEHMGRWLLPLVFLPHEALVACDAIVRTLARVAITRRHLLEWTSAAEAVRRHRRSTRACAWREMADTPLIAAAVAVAAAWWRPEALPVAMPFLLAWIVAPEVVRWIDRSPTSSVERLTPHETAALRRLARRTWLFFESFVGPDDHWLPPDHYQEEPHGEVAHRTSPTNVGMMFLSSLTAWDLGYVGPADLAFRLRKSFEALRRLEHYRGHLLNWYDTRTLEPLLPRYVSTVDSGNLAASLLALRQGCLEAAATPVLRAARWEGLIDTIVLLEESLERLGVVADDAAGPSLQQLLAGVRERARRARDDPRTWSRTVAELCEKECAALDRLLAERLAPADRPHDLAALREVRIWLDRAHQHLRGMQREIATLTPYLPALEALDVAAGAGATDEPLAETWRRLTELLPPALALDAIPGRCARARDLVAGMRARVPETTVRALPIRGASPDPAAAPAVTSALDALDQALDTAAAQAASLRDDLLGVAERAASEAVGMDFSLLYDRDTRVFHIGYNLTADCIDPHHYDLLASEARLASFVAIAKGDVPIAHWHALGRPLTAVAGSLTLRSWGGSMFEYLMPPLLMRSHENTLLGRSERGAVAAQIAWGGRHGLPWGTSESGYAVLDGAQHYQYRAFGIPELGLNRGLGADVVVAPYAALLALHVRPRAVLENVQRLCALGLQGNYGLYEAADFTPARLARGRRVAIVRTYMAHHQGMILGALGNHLCADALVRRFSRDLLVQTAALVLYERIPHELVPERPSLEVEVVRPPEGPAATLPVWTPVQAGAFPEVHVLGNGRLTSFVTDAGGGGLQWQGHALTRWTPDATLDAAGLWIYARDEESGAVWSPTRQPTGVHGGQADVRFHPHLAEFHRHEHGIALRMEVGVAPADDVEIRCLTVINETDRPRRLSFTSYGEVVLAPPADDEHHPAFSKLFVVGEHLEDLDALVFSRRPRRPEERPPALMHRLVAESPAVRCCGVETDRGRFLGRHGSVRGPRALHLPLSGTVGATLDTVMSVRAAVDLAPYATERLAFLTLAAESRTALLETAARHATLASLDWVLADAARAAGLEVRRLQLDPARLPDFQRIASVLVAAAPALRCPHGAIVANRLGQPRLWGLGLSGDLPIVLLRMNDANDATILRECVRAHQLWRRHGLAVDLVVLWQGASSYDNDIVDRLSGVLQELDVRTSLGSRGSVHLLHADQMHGDERQLLEVAARAVLTGHGRGLEQQLENLHPEPHYPPTFTPGGGAAREPTSPLERRADLRFDNGFGGFTADGREYVVHLAPGEHTPAPWANVLANADFGSVVTEGGGGYTWALNSAEFRLTPWRNDAVEDAPGEALYLRDEESAEVWTPTPEPAGGDVPCEIRHGAGYSEWQRRSHGLAQRLTMFVPPDDPVKIVRLELRNLQRRPRRVTATYYAQWVLGRTVSGGRPFVVTEYDAGSSAVLARNPWNPEFADCVAFLASDRRPHGFTTDRAEFIGREGALRKPAALGRWGLSDTATPGVDPCAALQVHLDVGPGEAAAVTFVLGAGRDAAEAQALLARWRDGGTVDAGWRRLETHWDRLLGAVSVRTPEPALDLMLNRWLLYQTVASRILARTGLYQSAGAFGFRDQLQDVMALVHADPARARDHILRCAAHQFEEGDVLHWWHPPLDRGVRTRCSDDLLWLPFVTAHYVEATGDRSLLDEEVAFLAGTPLAPGEHDRYARFDISPERRSVFEHCRRALERAITSGPHGLPLIGEGDWNDGMNRVGARGVGESIWLAWFAVATLRAMAAIADRVGPRELAHGWRQRADVLARTADEAGWDGAWYLRAFDDDGRPWGSASNDECRIDSIAQSWAVLSGGGTTDHAREALRSAERELVCEDERLVRLLWPPFDLTLRDPGYIKAYPPGIRENGGQYTHAAAWLGWALAALGDGDGAARILRLLNPVSHAGTHDDAVRYAVEPYVIAGDVAGVAPHVGHGGWTWYTGAAAWTWRLGVEAILGLQRAAGRVRIDPCLPRDWPGFTATIRGSRGTLDIEVDNRQRVARGVSEITVDGTPLAGNVVALPNDGAVHHVRVVLGPRSAPAAPNARRVAEGG